MPRWRVLLVLLVLLLVLGQPLLTRGVRGDRVIFGQDLTLAAGQCLDGDLVVFGGDVVLEPGSAVRGDVLALGGSLRIAGRIDRQALAPSGEVWLGETGAVAGDVLAAGSVVRDPGSVVGGQVIAGLRHGPSLSLLRRWPGRWPLGFPGLWFGWPWGVGLAGNLLVWTVQVLLGCLVVVALGILVVLLVPRPTRMASAAMASCPVQTISVGLLTWLLAFVVVVPLLTITLIGIPVAAAAVTALSVATLFGCIVAGAALGERVLTPVTRQPLLAVSIGLAILSALSSLPCLGPLLVALAGFWGLGAVLLTRFGTTPYGRPPLA